MTDSTLEYAHSYARAGIYVFPLYVKQGKDGKKDVRPAVLWRQASSISGADIEAWWGPGGGHTAAGIGIDCGRSELVVVDCDGPEGIENWAALKPLGTYTASTPGGGQHWFYRAHPDHLIGNDQDGKVAPHVDIRGIGGLVIAAPTTDWRGQYAWIDGDPDWADLPTVPQIVIERMKARPMTVPSSQLAPNSAQVREWPDDDLLQPVQREFTRDQAIAFVRAARAKLAATTGGLNGAINAFAMQCAHFPWLVTREQCALHVIKALGEREGWTAPDEQDRKTINSAYSATEAGRSWVAVEVSTLTGAEAPTGATRTEDTAATLPPPSQPLKVARELLRAMDHTEGEIHRAWWRGDFYAWTGAHWEVEELPAIEQWLYQQTGDAVFLKPGKEEGEFVPEPWAPTKKKIGDLVHALGVGELRRAGDQDHALAATNGVVVARELQPHRPSRFNLFSLPFAYEPDAECPAWETFLEQVLPGDRQAKEFLGEWFGYVLSGRTDQQKMAALIGKRRSGKGTIARVLGAMIGKENVAGVNLNLMAGTFGMENLIGKALATAGDVRWASRNIGDAVPILLEAIGEDTITIHRKNRPAWAGTLGTRFMLMSNETPTFSDRSQALGGRMVFVHFAQSFYGREDTALTEKLMTELPGILNWALDGLDRLTGRGAFTQPASGQDEADHSRRLSDPIGAFIEDWCEIGPDKSITLDHLFLKYRDWCEGEGRTKDSTTKEIFSRDLRAKVDGLEAVRTRVGGKQTRMFRGIGSTAL